MLFFFKAVENRADWSPRFAIYGDMGNENAQSLARLQRGTQDGTLDVILHVGESFGIFTSLSNLQTVVIHLLLGISCANTSHSSCLVTVLAVDIYQHAFPGLKCWLFDVDFLSIYDTEL